MAQPRIFIGNSVPESGDWYEGNLIAYTSSYRHQRAEDDIEKQRLKKQRRSTGRPTFGREQLDNLLWTPASKDNRSRSSGPPKSAAAIVSEPVPQSSKESPEELVAADPGHAQQSGNEPSRKPPGTSSAHDPPKNDRVLLAQPDNFKAGRAEVLYVLQHTIEGVKAPSKLVLNIAGVQRVALQDLRQKIAILVAMLKNHEQVHVKTEDSYALIDLLHKYTDGVRDLDYMQECAKRDFDHDPFLMMTSRELDWRAMKRAGLLPQNLDDLLPVAKDQKEPIPFASARYRHHANQVEATRQAVVRFVVAALGGLALIVPMIIMVLVPGKKTSLIVASVFTIAFAAALAWGTNLDPEKILAVTAGYAAVLVVFVGASI